MQGFYANVSLPLTQFTLVSYNTTKLCQFIFYHHGNQDAASSYDILLYLELYCYKVLILRHNIRINWEYITERRIYMKFTFEVNVQNLKMNH